MTASDLQIEALDGLPTVLSDDTTLYLRPGPLQVAGRAPWPPVFQLGRSGLGFETCEVILRQPHQIGAIRVPLAALFEWVAALPQDARDKLDGLLAGLRSGIGDPNGDPVPPRIMGILNVTPDSFFDGGRHADTEAAVTKARQLVAEGADILDLGGESTRPGAAPIPAEEELHRVVPVLDALADDSALRGVTLSIDTQKAVVMDAALARGVGMINDVSALTADPDSLAVAASSAATVVLMHRQGTPRDMNLAPHYVNAPLDVFDALAERIAACEIAGLTRERLLIDPGIGFGKGSGHTLEILRRLSLFHGLGCGLLLGLSRKGLTGALDQKYPPEARLPGSLAAALHALNHGARVLRVHDVAATRQAVEVWQRLIGLRD